MSRGNRSMARPCRTIESYYRIRSGGPVHDRAPSQSGFGGYTPAKDAETLGGSEGNYSSKGGDPFSTPGGSGSGIYANAMPETDAAQKYIDEELAYRREHKPSMLRRVLGTAASLYAPGSRAGNHGPWRPRSKVPSESTALSGEVKAGAG